MIIDFDLIESYSANESVFRGAESKLTETEAPVQLRSRRTAAVSAAANIKSSTQSNKRKSDDHDSSKKQNSAGDLKLFHSNSSSSSDTSKKRTSESATATAIVNSMSIDETPKEEIKLKSIVKSANENKPPGAVGRPKRVVKILEELDVKKDQILQNVKPDNKQKHTASTSTPSGGRRKPLKAPHDVSLIVKKWYWSKQIDD